MQALASRRISSETASFVALGDVYFGQWSYHAIGSSCELDELKAQSELPLYQRRAQHAHICRRGVWPNLADI